jgi:hypothetical protein
MCTLQVCSRVVKGHGNQENQGKVRENENMVRGKGLFHEKVSFRRLSFANASRVPRSQIRQLGE